MPMSDVVDVQVSRTTTRVKRAGFGIPLVLSFSADWGERIRFYDDLDGVGADFLTTDVEYKQAAALFAQRPSPRQIAIGRCANKPTQEWKVVPVAGNAKVYSITVEGLTYSYTSDATGTAAEIIGGLVALINAGTAAHGITASDQTTYMKLLAAQGAWKHVEVANPALLALSQEQADPGLAADLDAIKLENNTWYLVLCPFASKAMLQAVAAWVETARKLAVLETQDTAVITAAAAGATDVAAAELALSHERSAIVYSPRPNEFLAAGWVGRCASLDPGSETWKFKTVSGAAATGYTATHITNLKAKKANWYEEVGGVSIMAEGTVAEGEFIDVIRFCDWLEARMAEGVFGDLAAQEGKVPYDETGIAMVEGRIRAVLTEGVAKKGLRANPEPTVTVPEVAEVSDADRGERLLPDVKFSAQLAGAIHKVRVRGTVSV